MFLPIGDNIERRTFPVLTIALILINVVVYGIQFRKFHDAYHGTNSGKVACHAGRVCAAQFDDMEYGDEESEWDMEEWESCQDGAPWGEDLEKLKAAYEAEFAFIKTWGLTPAELSQGQVIGLLTHMFLHGDFLHLLGNMVVLWAFACSLEAGFGRWTFLGFYILFGFAGGLAHFAANLGSDIPLIGASGAIAGLIGAYTVLYGPWSKIKTLFFFGYRVFTFQIPAAAFGFGWFLLQLLQADLDSDGASGVAWFAHIGGFVAGVVVAFVCRNDTACELTGDDDGNLVLGAAPAANPALAARAAPPADSFDPASNVCPYCHQELGNGQMLAANMIRCGNPNCQRLVYLQEAAANTLSAR
jgi:membrane associated rhomboid family serine protease